MRLPHYHLSTLGLRSLSKLHARGGEAAGRREGGH